MQYFSLYEFNSLIRQAIDTVMPEAYWVQAEISELRVNRHCYLELVQKGERGQSMVAKARAQIWAQKWAYLSNYFTHTTGQTLRPGMQVLVCVQVTFHELYGFSLNIIDIDPTYTLGDIARRRQEIINTLKAEGIFDMNKELELPRLIQRIAVVSAAGAAGYGDFVNQLHSNAYGLAFETQLFPALMQGDGVEQSVINALGAIADDMDAWDVVVIIRGGGSTSDLSGFDSLLLAENIAQFPLPVITGIGHERDDTVIDLVSHTRVKTPTAAAEFIIHHQEAEYNLVMSLQDRIYDAVTLRIQRERMQLQLLTNRFPTLFATFRTREEARLDTLMQRIKNSAELSLTSQRHKLDVFAAKVSAADPQHILKLGFSITRVDGKAIRSAVPEGTVVETTLADGVITSIVKG